MTLVGTDETLGIHMQCTISWLFVNLYPPVDDGAYSSFMGKEPQKHAEVHCIWGPTIKTHYTLQTSNYIHVCNAHWTFWGL